MDHSPAFVPSIFIGAIAFVATAIHVALCFPVFFKMITSKGQFSSAWLALLFLVAFVMYAAWLIYLWPLNDLFVRIGNVLQLISVIIFFLQWLWIKKQIK